MAGEPVESPDALPLRVRGALDATAELCAQDGTECRLVVKFWFPGQVVWIKFSGSHGIDSYQAKNHPVDPPDPIDAILLRMEQMGLTRADLVPIIGSRSRVSEVLNRRRDLTIAMIARIREKLGIPADTLIGRQRAA